MRVAFDNRSFEPKIECAVERRPFRIVLDDHEGEEIPQPIFGKLGAILPPNRQNLTAAHHLFDTHHQPGATQGHEEGVEPGDFDFQVRF